MDRLVLVREVVDLIWLSPFLCTFGLLGLLVVLGRDCREGYVEAVFVPNSA
jgi:hypothetical protein